MNARSVAGFALLAVIAIAAAGDAQTAPVDAPAGSADVIHVAPPTGEREADRASILAALEQVRPGGTVQFAPGTYRLGGRIEVSGPRVVLLGSPSGTTLRGCDPAELVNYDDPALRSGSCAGLDLTGARQTVRNLTFEHVSWASLNIIGGRDGQRLLPAGIGGHLIEGNTFRDSDSFNVVSDASEPIVIRGNSFVNTYHAVAIQGRNVHFLDNVISAPDPQRIPYGRADIAVGIAQFRSTGPSCEDNVIAGNRIDGHPEGIAIGVFAPGASCRGNIVRGNTIAVERATLPAWERLAIAEWAPWARTDSIAVGVAIRLLNYPRACEEAPPGLEHGPMCPPDGSSQEALLSTNLIEGNRVVGGEGIAIEVLYGSGNRIVDNTISGVTAWERFPGAVLRHPPQWARANGSGIWVSAGSDENEIVGNTFEDIATHAVVLEGDRNRVETRSARDVVRDMGSGNQVAVALSPAAPAAPAEEVRARTEAFFAALSDDSPTFVGPLFYAPDAEILLSGGVVLEGLEAIARDFLRPNVARLRGVRPSHSRLVAGRDTVTWIGAFRARFAPAADTIEAQLSTTWVRQPDGRWLIAASALELPTRGDGTREGPIRSRFFHSEGLRLHALDFGGEGVPIVFMPNRDRTAYTFIDFAPRFTDRARVLAVTSRGSGQSEGEADGAPTIAALGRDVIALLDSLQVERAVVAHAWGEVLVYLAEQHPERVAGLVFLQGTPSPDFPRLWDEDPTRALTMVLRLFASRDGADPGDAVRAVRERWYSAEYLRTDRSIGVPALVFVDESGTPIEDEQVAGLLALGREVAGDPMSVPDPVARDYFVRLSSDLVAQDELRALYRDRVGPAFLGADDRFRRAFGEQLRMAPVEGRAIGYGYRDAPDLIEPHIRRFLEEVRALERRRSASSIPR